MQMQPEPRWLRTLGRAPCNFSIAKGACAPPAPLSAFIGSQRTLLALPRALRAHLSSARPAFGRATFDRGTGARAYDDDAARHMPPPRAGGARPPPARRHHLYRTPAATTTRPTCMRASRVSLVSSRQRSSAMERRVLRVLIRRARRRRPSTSSRSSTTSSRVRSTRTPPST